MNVNYDVNIWLFISERLAAVHDEQLAVPDARLAAVVHQRLAFLGVRLVVVVHDERLAFLGERLVAALRCLAQQNIQVNILLPEYFNHELINHHNSKRASSARPQTVDFLRDRVPRWKW